MRRYTNARRHDELARGGKSNQWKMAFARATCHDVVALLLPSVALTQQPSGKHASITINGLVGGRLVVALPSGSDGLGHDAALLASSRSHGIPKARSGLG